MRETWVQSLGQEDPLEKEMATHSSIQKPGGLQTIASQRVGHDWATSLSLSLFLSLFWILFQLDSISSLLFCLVGFHHVPLPDEYLSAFSSCWDCCVWGGFSVCWKFMVPLYCGGSSLGVGLNEWLVKVSCSGKLASVFWCLQLVHSLWSAMKCPVVRFEVSMGLVWLLATCIFCSGLCSCYVRELAWYVLIWNSLTLGWSLVSV